MLFLYIFQPWFFSSNMLLYAIFHISNTVWTLMSSWLHTHVIQPTHARSALVAMPAFLSAAENGPIFMLASFAYLVPPAWNCLLMVGMTAKRPTPFPFLCAHTLPRPLKCGPHCEYGHSSLAVWLQFTQQVRVRVNWETYSCLLNKVFGEPSPCVPPLPPLSDCMVGLSISLCLAYSIKS